MVNMVDGLCLHQKHSSNDRGSSVSIVTRRSEFYFQQVQRWDFFLLVTASVSALVPTQPLVQCVQKALPAEVKRPVCENDRSSLSSAEIGNASLLCAT